MLIEADGMPTPELRSMIASAVTSWIEYDRKAERRTQWLITAVQDRDGNDTYWGLIDVVNTPQEDIYLAVEQRFYCAYRTIGEERLVGMGLIDAETVLTRQPLPKLKDMI